MNEKNDIHVIESNVRHAEELKKKFLFTKHDHECVAWLFLNSTKSKQSLKIMRYGMISYLEAVLKN